jgi:Fe2+ or Zn2+ uptake regulation protein
MSNHKRKLSIAEIKKIAAMLSCQTRLRIVRIFWETNRGLDAAAISRRIIRKWRIVLPMKDIARNLKLLNRAGIVKSKHSWGMREFFWLDRGLIRSFLSGLFGQNRNLTP